MDIACLQRSFSWKSKTHPGLYQRLDRAIASNNFFDKFPHSSVKYCTFTSSDHAPVFFDTNSGTLPTNKIFRFQNSWTLEEETSKIIKAKWMNNIQGSRFFRIRTKLSEVKIQLKSWAKQKFTHKTKQLKDNIDKIHKLESKLVVQPFNPILQKHLNRMLKQREKILLYSQHSWKSTAKKTWLNQGVRNTRFFHQIMKQRAARNHIFRLKNNFNQWEEGQEKVQKVLFDSFKEIFNSTAQGGRNLNLDFIPRLVSDAEGESLVAPFFG